jgi:hypothetical protein
MPPRIERLPEGAAGPVAPARTGPKSLAEIVAMARSGTSANVIIQTLRESPVNYALSASEASDLARQGVPQEVIDYLLRREPRAPATPVYSGYSAYPAYPAYAPLVAPGIFYSRWGFGPYPRYGGAGFSFRFGFRR